MFIKFLQFKVCDFKSESLDNLVTLGVTSKTSLPWPPFCKTDFGGYAHSQYEESFTHWLSMGLDAAAQQPCIF